MKMTDELLHHLERMGRISNDTGLQPQGTRGPIYWVRLTENMPWITNYKLEQLERLRSEDTPRRLMITHTIGSQVKKIIDLELKTLQSRHDFQSQGQMTLKI